MIIILLLLILFSYTNSYNPIHFNTPYQRHYVSINNISVKIYNPVNKLNIPCVIFLTGLNNNIPIYAYDYFFKELSKNTTIISIKHQCTNPKNYNKTTEKTSEIIKWCQNDLVASQSNLNLYLSKFNCSYNNNLSLISHSSSAQTIINYLQVENYNKYLDNIILIDPVDGDLNYNKNKILKKPIHITKPLLIIANKYGNNFKDWPNFNPEEISSKHFYDNIETKDKKILVSMLEFGHGDLLNDNIIELAELLHIIKSYKKNNNYTLNSYKKYRELLSKIIINFINKDYFNLNMNIIKSNLLIDCINF
jgi:hypothetical protein